MKKFRQLNIKVKIGIIFLFMLLVSLVSGILILYQNNIALHYQTRIFLAKENENIIPRLGYLAALIKDGDGEAREDLKAQINRYESNLNLLKNGGEANVPDGKISLKSITAKASVRFTEVEQAWSLYKSYTNIFLDANQTAQIDTTVKAVSSLKKGNLPIDAYETLAEFDDFGTEEVITGPLWEIVKIPNPKLIRAFEQIHDKTDNLYKLNQALTIFYTTSFQSEKVNISTILIISLIISIGLFFIGYNFIIKRIVIPIQNITDFTQKLVEGETQQKIIYEEDDEIGDLTNNLTQLAQGLRKTTDFAKSIGQGKFDYPFEAKSEKDNLGYALLNMRESLKNINEADRIRSWANEGFANFVDILKINYDNLEELAYKVVSNLVKYLSANQGGFFVLNEHEEGNDEKENKYLEMVASFAYEKRKYLQKRVELGQGLVGQAVLEEDTLHIKHVPDEYAHISSGLGEAAPRNLLIVPLINNDKVYGAIEIASFKPFQDYEVEFVEKLSANIASTIANTKNNERIQNLLETAESNTDVLKEQEERMLITVEELEATQEAMMENQRELEDYKTNLELQVQQRTAEILEKEKQLSEALILASLAPWRIDLQTDEFVANEYVYQLLKTSPEAEGGYHMPVSNFINKFIQEDQVNQLSEEIALAARAKDAGYIHQMEYRLKRGDGRPRTVVITIKTEKDKEGNTIALLGSLQDITRQKRLQDQIALQNEALEKQRAEQEKFVAMVENVTDYVFMTNMDYKIVYANKVGEQNFGVTNYSKNTIQLKDLFTEKEWHKFYDDVLPTVLQYEIWTGDLSLRSFKTQQLTPMNGSVFAVKNAQNELSAIALVLRDMTESIKTTQEIELANARMSSVLESTDDMIVAVDTQFNILAFNTHWSNLIKKSYNTTPQIGMNMLQDLGMDEKFSEQLRLRWEQAFQEAYSMVETYGITNKVYWLRTFNPMHDKEGKVIGAVSFTKDVSEKQRAENAILESEQRLRIISEGTIEGIIVHEKGIIQTVNEAVCNISGFDEDEIIGKLCTIFLTPESQVIATQNLMTGYDKPYQADLLRKDKIVIPVEIHARNFVHEGKPVRIVSIRDISEQKKNEKLVLLAQERLKKQMETLTYLTSPEAQEAGLTKIFHITTQSIAEALSIARTSIWQFKQNKITCLDLFEKEKDQHTRGETLLAKDYPNFFKHLRQEAIIDVPDIQDNALIQDLATYLKGFDVVSTLIIPIRVGRTLLGMISCEHTGEPRTWTLEDKGFLSALVGILALKIEKNLRE